jgi:pyruvate dehydrogenase E2 component (dihydrolipoamide acetyltransferase)
VSLDEMQGGTFTISNQGGIGGGHFTPVVNTPEVAILGIGRGVVKPVVKDGKIVPRTMLPITLSYDHRVVDGASAARFVADLVKLLEGFKESDVAL